MHGRRRPSGFKEYLLKNSKMQISEREKDNENTRVDPEKLFRENTKNVFTLVKVSSRKN